MTQHLLYYTGVQIDSISHIIYINRSPLNRFNITLDDFHYKLILKKENFFNGK